jgi:hypothetical protein
MARRLWCRWRSVCYRRCGRDREMIAQNCIVRGHRRLSGGVFWRHAKSCHVTDVSHSRDLIPGQFCRLVSESLVLGTFSGFIEGHVRQAIEYLTTLVSDCSWMSFGMITRLRRTRPKSTVLISVLCCFQITSRFLPAIQWVQAHVSTGGKFPGGH